SIFRPIGREDRVRAAVPPVQEPAKPLEQPLPALPAGGSGSGKSVQLNLGEEAFKAGEYGRAERRFREASESPPDQPRAYFLLAQARFALAKYQEAVMAIEAGLRLQPDWPRSGFRVRELYAGRPEDFSQQLTRLKEVSAKYPGDRFLPFL